MHGSCKCMHHNLVGIAVLVIGAAFLLQTLGVLSASAVSYIWPIALVVAGGVKAFGNKCSCCGEEKGGSCCQQ